MYIYIQFIVHLLTFLLVHQVAQWVKLHNIHIEEQPKKHMKDRHLLEYQPCTSRRDEGQVSGN